MDDIDIDLLFDPALDGLEGPGAHPDTSPPINLEFERWFVRFGGDWQDSAVDVLDDA